MEVNSWSKILSTWNKYKVPNITCKKFIPEEHAYDSPWLNNKDFSQPYYDENPIKATAYHLAIYLKEKNPDLIATYKILAFLKETRSKHQYSDVLKNAFKNHSESYGGWWHPNSKYVLPYVKSLEIHSKKLEIEDWEVLTSLAAKSWIDIADNWSIIIIPKFMDSNSIEFNEYQNYLNKIHNENEYRKYIRLKEKFDGK